MQTRLTCTFFSLIFNLTARSSFEIYQGSYFDQIVTLNGVIVLSYSVSWSFFSVQFCYRYLVLCSPPRLFFSVLIKQHQNY